MKNVNFFKYYYLFHNFMFESRNSRNKNQLFMIFNKFIEKIVKKFS